MKIKYVTLILAIFGILALYTLSLYAQPPIISLSELPHYEGNIVTTQGTVTKYYETSYGNQIITIRDNNTTATIFSSTPLQIQSGDLLQATGNVEKYKDTWEILIDDTKSINILQKWNQTTTPLWEIAQNPIAYLDYNLNVTGYVDSKFNTYFYFTDNNTDHTILVPLPQSKNLTIYTGQPVSLSAQFTYDPTQLRYIFTFTEPYHTITPLTGGTSDD
jgi:hypothetical protein